ncbi:hypothetical protein LSCM1_06767 [Leishmania martiniquensis]|uniref:Complex 1 LYR protein domain-containing protein n=1 Tax=Leishmania martiniquensis TaxID=1580590 RepID=A0A836GXT4_9TRYP|nr:hypothetical protein LSCM1_06767 [Leishmania martiniquensis]
MRACLHLTRVSRHQRRDKGGNAHNFPFDTLTKVYRDAVYAPQEQYQGNPMHPERDRGTSPSPGASFAASQPSDAAKDVSSAGAMSPVAAKLAEWMERQHQKEGPRHHRGNGDLSPTSSRARPIARSQATASFPSPASSAAASTTEGSHAGDETMRQKLRAHLFSERKQLGRQMEVGLPRSASSTPAAAGSASPRRSGVQTEILSVYRSMLREVARMQDADTRRHLLAYIRQEYDKQRGIPRKEIMKIEWRLNYSKRKLEDLQAMDRHTKFTVMR